MTSKEINPIEEIFEQNPQMDRRNFLDVAWKISLGAVGAVGIGTSFIAARNILKAVGSGEQDKIPDYLLRFYPAPINPVESEAARRYWGRTYQVEEGDRISGIAAKVYHPDYNDNQPFYDAKLRFANRLDPTKNALIFPGQDLYIPNPRIPTFGFAAGEEAILRGQELDGKYYPTKIKKIDIENGVMVFNYIDDSQISLKEGGEFVTSRRLRIAAILNGIPNLVPPRVVLEFID